MEKLADTTCPSTQLLEWRWGPCAFSPQSVEEARRISLGDER